MIKVRFNKKGEEDTGKPIPFIFKILLISATAAAAIYMLVMIYNAFLPK